MHVSQAGFEVLTDGVTVDPCVFIRGKVPEINQEKPVSHEKAHGKEADCDVVFTVHFEKLTKVSEHSLILKQQRPKKSFGLI